jgi:peptidoglycan/LPS O-acetylase OafA/YrhL
MTAVGTSRPSAGESSPSPRHAGPQVGSKPIGGNQDQPRRYGGSFRPDIEGLRAVAVLAVLGYHAALPIMPGGYVGVDVFFVISGFLITGLLLGDIEKRGRFSLKEFYARRARRILPAAGVVLAATSAASVLWLSPLRRQDVAYDVIASALNVSNWRFIAEQTDYLAQGRAQSPLLHYWSLSVEEQFYLVWAPLLLLLVLLAAWIKRSPIPLIAVAVVAMTVASFVTSLHWTSTNVPLAYLGSPSRAWQFGVGALGALVAPRIGRALSKGRVYSVVLGLAGAAAVLWAAVRYDNDTPYPGVAAVLPVVGTVAVMLAGTPGARPLGFGWLLATPPVRAIGRVSYSWYLWHWPVLVIWEARFGPTQWPTKLALVGAAGVLAWLTMLLVENPVRLAPRVAAVPWRGLAAGLASVVLAVAAGLVLNADANRALDVAEVAMPPLVVPPAPADPANIEIPAIDEGHLYLPPYPSIPLGPPHPSPRQARTDYPELNGCQLDTGATTNGTCLFGDPESKDRVVLFGDSHAMEWYPALAEVARTRGWSIEVLGKSGCPVSTVAIENGKLPQADRECATWRDGAISRIVAESDPLIIFVGTMMEGTYTGQSYIDAWDSSLGRLAATGAPIVYLRDTPYPGKDIPECVSGIPVGSDACGFPRSGALIPDAMADLIGAGQRSGVYLFDVTNALCPLQTCPAIIDGVLMYSDYSHITATAATVLAPRLELQLTKAGLIT